MSSSTLAQIAEKPITVTTDEAISSFADSRQGRLAELAPSGSHHSLPAVDALQSLPPA